jgi:hypothetical protein
MAEPVHAALALFRLYQRGAFLVRPRCRRCQRPRAAVHSGFLHQRGCPSALGSRVVTSPQAWQRAHACSLRSKPLRRRNSSQAWQRPFHRFLASWPHRTHGCGAFRLRTAACAPFSLNCSRRPSTAMWQRRQRSRTFSGVLFPVSPSSWWRSVAAAPQRSHAPRRYSLRARVRLASGRAASPFQAGCAGPRSGVCGCLPNHVPAQLRVQKRRGFPCASNSVPHHSHVTI